MNHNESSLQIRCINKFRAKYPWAAKLLIHVKNEEAGGRIAGAIHKAEGVVAGAPDLLLLIPSSFLTSDHCPYLCIEMKAKGGRKRDSQILYRTYVQAVGSHYVFCYSEEDFDALTDEYMKNVNPSTIECLKLQYRAEDAERIRKAREELQGKVVGKSTPRRKKSIQTAKEELFSILNK